MSTMRDVVPQAGESDDIGDVRGGAGGRRTRSTANGERGYALAIVRVVRRPEAAFGEPVDREAALPSSL